MLLCSSAMLVLLCLTHLNIPPSCFARELTIKPASDPCDSSSEIDHGSINTHCYTLDQALAEVESNDILHLSPGIHSLTTFQIVNSTDLENGKKLSNVSIVGNTADRNSVVIRCSEGVGLVFLNIKELEIAGVTVENCGLSIDNFMEALEIARQKVDIIFAPLDDFSTAVFMCNCWNLLVNNVTIQNNRGFGFVGVNLLGNTTFNGTHILSNFPDTCIVFLADYTSAGGSGGGMLIIYQDYHPGQEAHSQRKLEVTLRFENAWIKNNYACRLDLFAVLYNKLARSISSAPHDETIDFIGAGGLSLFIAQGSYRVDATFQSCIFENNSSTYNGAALEISQFEASNDSHVKIYDSQFLHNGGRLESKYGHQALDPAGALFLLYYVQIPTQYSSTTAASEFLSHVPSTVEVYRTTFIGNTAVNGGGLAVFSYGPAIGFIQDVVTVENCTFVNNSAEHGAAIYATEISYSGFEPGVAIIFRDIYVINNTEINVSTGIVNINFLHVTFNGTNHFLHNRDTALSLYNSVATMSGSFEFIRNTGNTGGAIKLMTESYIILSDKVDMHFIDNVGIVYGGAIYVDFETIRFDLYDCFLFINDIDPFCSLFETCNLPEDNQVSITFINNTAPFGSVIYGSSFSNCPWINDSVFFFDHDKEFNGHQKAETIKQNLETIESWVKFYPSLYFSSNDSQNSINTVAFAIINEEHNFNPVYNVMPGQQFSVNLRAFDQLLQSVPLTVFSRLSPINGSSSGIDQATSSISATDRYLLLGGKNYTEVPITVYGKQNTRYIVTITSSEAQVEFNITVNLSECAVGFKFNNNTSSPDLTGLRCVCAIGEAIRNVECNNDGTVSYPVDDWIGIDENGEYIIHECIFDYCKRDIVQLTLDNPDFQCRNNRAGILCGGCKENYSRVIGGSSCRQCENNYGMSLIILFAALGIALVVFISVFNLTITNGYINGFIFYANIFTVYIFNLVPLTGRTIYFVSFLNLYFGIETCFYDGMTELHLAGLELIFPFYLLGILLVITLFAKYCRLRKFDKFISNIRVTHVFVTLILLSYTNLIRTCIVILGSVTISTPEGQSTTRWRNDPNILYFQDGIHFFLVFVSIILLCFLIPLSVLLLIPRTLLGLPLTKRLKPFIDACIAPFESNKTFWFGLRLIVRLIVYLVVILLNRGIQLITVAMIVTLLTILQAFLKPFKSMGQNIVDLSLLVNLSLVSILSIYLFPLNLESDNSSDIVLTIFGAIFVVSFFILVFSYIIGTIPYTKRLYEGIKLSVLNSLVSLKKKANEFKFSTCMKIMERKIKHGSNESIALSNIKDSDHVFTHTSVRLADSGEHTQTEECTDLRESLLSSNNIQ